MIVAQRAGERCRWLVIDTVFPPSTTTADAFCAVMVSPDDGDRAAGAGGANARRARTAGGVVAAVDVTLPPPIPATITELLLPLVLAGTLLIFSVPP